MPRRLGVTIERAWHLLASRWCQRPDLFGGPPSEHSMVGITEFRDSGRLCRMVAWPGEEDAPFKQRMTCCNAGRARA
jgi:hypothetical protein